MVYDIAKKDKNSHDVDRILQKFKLVYDFHPPIESNMQTKKGNERFIDIQNIEGIEKDIYLQAQVCLQFRKV